MDYETRTEYMVVVTATDPSGASDAINVMITVTDGPDDAVITGVKTYTYAEDRTDEVATFSASDQDGNAIEWGKSGDDAGAFKVTPSEDGLSAVLTFAKQPDFEKPADDRADNIYKVTVTASGGRIDVEVTVTDVDELGKPTLTKPQPQVDRGLEALGPNDPDVPITDVLWQWARSMDMDNWDNIGNPTPSGSRNPVEADLGYYLRATAMYTDSFGSGKTASVVSENKVEERTLANARPSFADHEDSDDDATNGIQIARDVDEGIEGAQVGKPITAKDDDTALLYSLELANNPDTADVDESKLFGINPRTGQITTKMKLDSNDGTGDTVTYTVEVTASDPSGADESVDVVITVNDVNDAPVFPDANSPSQGNNLRAIEVAENVTDLDLSTYNATDADEGDDVTGTADLTYIVDGADKDAFTIADGTDGTTLGQLTLKKSPNYETKSSYSITVMAEDDEFAVGKVDVKVTVTNADDPGCSGLQCEGAAGWQAGARHSHRRGRDCPWSVVAVVQERC